ncbi:hypothetical protein [Leptospira vanthielii]|uniref:Uncharacterized protein n=1 Tax=Leptospira vanthielii TaxID=293085 RepID=A0ABY2NTC7_9LEPT|nr:hypothetical protein [Leptospira vanthielii]TGM60674.1 hypothetical protein EHQ95_02010 [Leptospira vanthielii]
MKVTILIYPRFGFLKIHSPWIYLGSNVQKYQTIQSGSEWKPIFLSENIQKQKRILLPKILKFIKELGFLNGNSLSWEMTQLAGRNNLESPFFLSVVQISAIIHYILNKTSETKEELIVICEDPFLAKALKGSLKKYGVIVHFPLFTYFSRKWLEIFYSIAYFFFQLVKQAKIQYQYAKQAKLTRNKKKDFSNDEELLLFHLCLTEKNILSEKKLTCNYFTTLLDYLESKGKNVVRIPWLFSVRQIPRAVVFSKLRESGVWIPEDYLNLFDYISSFTRSIFSSFSLVNKIPFGEVEVSALLDREFWLHFRSSPNLNSFYKYYGALEKSFPLAKKVRSYDHFENMPFEKVIPTFFRSRRNLDFLQIGYHHSLVSDDFLGYHLYEGEEHYIHFPDFIITNGPLDKNRYKIKPIGEDRIISGPSLRQKFVELEDIKDRKNQLAILLSMDIGASIEILTIFLELDSFLSERGIQVILRAHPLLPFEVIKKKLVSHSLPSHWKISNRDLYDDLLECKFAAVMGSASIIDAVLAGCVPIPISRLLDFDWNGLDFLSDKHKILNSVSGENLKDHLQYLFSLKHNEVVSEIKSVVGSLLQGINSDENQMKDKFLI